ncbi:3700_t:CDS:2 [Ambispora leptoticha]|uniref:3700_t:CDS:1 n=1 Tax=Ambispora leptoticha TaxID=144679 RepID=A0A9N9G4P3_9GLOM|nr:3700_t:CDS:2 [Ambispora leptoticha]
MDSILKIVSLFSFWDVINVLLLLFFLHIFKFYLEYYTRENPLAGPFPLPLIGSLYQYPGEMIPWIYGLYKKHGDMFELWNGSKRQIFLNDAKLIDKIAQNSTKSKYLVRFAIGLNKGLEQFADPRSGMLFNGDVVGWRNNRKLVDHVLMSPNFQRETIKMIEKYFTEMEGFWNELGMNNMQHLSVWANRLLADLMFDLTTGRRCYFMAKYYNSITKTNKKDVPLEEIKFCDDFVKGSTDGGPAVRFLLLAPEFVWRYLLRNLTRKYLETRARFNAVFDNLLEQRRAQMRNLPVGAELRPDILTLILNANTEIPNNQNSTRMSDTDIRDTLAEIIVGSVSTTANVFAFLVEYIGRHHHIKEKVELEINSTFGQRIPPIITIENLGRLQYLEAVICEALRLTPGAFLQRTNTEEDEIGGYRWKAGTEFCINMKSIHFNPRVWPDPDEFVPERFFDHDNGKYKKDFLSFGCGLRICPGRNLAFTILKSMTVLLYLKYDVTLLDTESPIKCKQIFLNQLDCLGARVILTPRRDMKSSAE